MPIYFLLQKLSVVATVLVAVIIFLKRNKIFPGSAIWFRHYFILAAVIDIVMMVITSMGIPNMGYGSLFLVIRFYMYGMAMIPWLQLPEYEGKLKTVNLVLSVAFLIHVLATYQPKMLDILTISIENVLMVILSGAVLFRIIEYSNEHLTSDYRFWISVAAFIYFSVSTVVFTTGNLLLSETMFLRRYTWAVHAAVMILANLIYIKGILCLPEKKT